MPHVTYHLSPVTFDMSPVTCHLSHVEPGQKLDSYTNESSHVFPIHDCSKQLTRHRVFYCPDLKQRARPGRMSCPLVWSKRESQGSGPTPGPQVLAGMWQEFWSGFGPEFYC